MGEGVGEGEWEDLDSPSPWSPPDRGGVRVKGEKRAKIKDESGSGKTIQEDWDRKDKGKEGICSTYPDKEISQSKTGS